MGQILEVTFLNLTRTLRSFRSLRTCGRWLLVFALTWACVPQSFAQENFAWEGSPGTAGSSASSDASANDAMLMLPDAPRPAREIVSSSVSDAAVAHVAVVPAAGFGFDPVRRQRGEASVRDMYILPGESAPQLTAGDKFVMGIRDSVSPFSMIGWVASALYAQVIDGSPNYGSNGKAFAQRLGASAARASSEDIFSNSVMAPLFHEDPRYYKMGRGHSILKRGVYAATRTIITRTDEGRATANFSLLVGNLAGSALTNVYYPQRNRTFSQTTETFAGSIGGSALGFVVSEFLSDTLQLVHLKKSE